MNEEQITAPSLTYAVSDNGRIIGKIDGAEAMLQAIHKILSTQRFVFPIYDDQYGHDLDEIIGKDYDYARAEFERMVFEALKGDDRVDDVTIIEVMPVDKNTINAVIEVETMYGMLSVEKEVAV